MCYSVKTVNGKAMRIRDGDIDYKRVRANSCNEGNHGLICHVERGTLSGYQDLKFEWQEAARLRGAKIIWSDEYGKKVDVGLDDTFVLRVGNRLFINPKFRRVTRIGRTYSQDESQYGMGQRNLVGMLENMSIN